MKLQEIIRNLGKIPYKLIKYYLASIAEALNYLHSRNIIYRNLNPNDIIIKYNGKLVLIDFSCAKKVN
jgi:serine/threonine protein kinase